MAKLMSYYRLCPLIDIKNLLGITEDAENGNIIVTLGRNIAIKYRLFDQKQLYSWRTKEKYSSPVHYDKKLGKYVAVFNQTFIRIWQDEEESLDKVKKYKFNQPINKIITHNGETFVVFKSGSVYPLSEVLEIRKTFSPIQVLDTKENIKDICYASLGEDLYVLLFIKTEDSYKFFWTIYSNYSKNKFSQINLTLNDTHLLGYDLFIRDRKAHLLTIWNDGKMYLKQLIREDREQSNVGELFGVIDGISMNHSVKMLPLDHNYIAIYGSEPSEEGATLLIYNTEFKLIQTKQIHKLYTQDAKIWKTYNFILLPVGQNLIVVPFSLQLEQLVSLIGSHKPTQSKLEPDIAFVTEYEIGHWCGKDEIIRKGKKTPKALKNKLKALFKDGCPDSVIIEQIIPDILEQGDVNILMHTLKYFTDIPEKFLSSILQFSLSVNENNFSKNTGNFYTNLPKELLPHERVSLLDKILVRQFSDIILLPYLRNSLTVDQAVLLLKYLIYQLSEDGHCFAGFGTTETEQCICMWMSIVIDSNYQKFILSKDSEIEKILMQCKNIVLKHLEIVDELKGLLPVLMKVKDGIEGKSCVSETLINNSYSIEIIDY
ncbi:hypothetical protein ABEB36_007554 [Hypothenemus hampei]|uniref:Nucleolar protein 11 n=1 Tax=Hypothenemus hampei TaxID=57062 RepID=A0ABD1EUE8_HYPHA